jgi:hypothetical protein
VALESPRDTVVTYNLPSEVITQVRAKAISAGYGFYQPGSFTRIKLGYTRLAPAERTAIVCLATIWLYPFNRATNNGTEIRTVCASVAP